VIERVGSLDEDGKPLCVALPLPASLPPCIHPSSMHPSVTLVLALVFLRFCSCSLSLARSLSARAARLTAAPRAGRHPVIKHVTRFHRHVHHHVSKVIRLCPCPGVGF